MAFCPLCKNDHDPNSTCINLTDQKMGNVVEEGKQKTENKFIKILTEKTISSKYGDMSLIDIFITAVLFIIAMVAIAYLFDWLVNKKMWQVVISVPLAFLINWVRELWDWLGYSYNRIWILGAIFALYILNKLEKLHKRFDDIEKHLQEVKWFLEKKDRQQGNR